MHRRLSIPILQYLLLVGRMSCCQLFLLLLLLPVPLASAAGFAGAVRDYTGSLSILEFLQLVFLPAREAEHSSRLVAESAHGGGMPVTLVTFLLVLLVGLIAVLLFRLGQMRRRINSLEGERAILTKERRRFETVFNSGLHGCAIAGLDGRYILANSEFCRRLGKSEREIIGKTPVEIGLFEEMETRDEIRAELLENGCIAPREVITTRGSGVAFAIYSCCLIDFEDGPAVYIMLMDITEQKRQAEVLRASEESFNNLFRAAPIPMAFAFDSDGYRATTWNDAWYRTFGYSREEADGKSGAEIGLWVNPEDRQQLVAGSHSRTSSSFREADLRCKDGSIKHCEVYGRFIGKPSQQILSAAYLDVTERKRAAEEKEKLQKQLALSQRLESVGQLAGGVAHDYNNMLGVILGHVELAQLKAGKDHPLAKHLGEIQRAARKSADLTMQLLAFARRQTISPVVVDLNSSVTATLEMLRWLIGENIELVWLPGGGKFPVKIDASQFDQVLVNLCVNARDAISGTGKITIETAMVDIDAGAQAESPYMVPGRYVLLTVADSGCGMDKMVQTRIFEPFFTTKSLGQGTGLGLATVYGIVKQNNGFINVYSEPGKGTVFKIYFPAEEQEQISGQLPRGLQTGRGNGETVLLVEDEIALLEINATMLKDLGYKVVSASLPGEALRLAKENTQLDLLMTDVIMPEMNGRELAQEIRKLHPEIVCLFMSGYTSNVISRHGILEKGLHFIQKPFSLQKLSHKVRDALNSRT